jgi:hypothetical protein
MVKDGWYGSPIKTIPDASCFFRGPLTLYRRPTHDLREALESLYEPVRVAVIYVNPHEEIQVLSFVFERRMLEMLKMRGSTNGRCTDLFGAANIHVDLGPLCLGMGYPCLGIGQDEGIEVPSLGYKMFLSKLDLMHCIYCKERFVNHNE